MPHDLTPYHAKILPTAELEQAMRHRPHLAPLRREQKGRDYALLDDYTFADMSGRTWTIPAGYTYDGASVPTLTGLAHRVALSRHDNRAMRAALVHDWFCDVRPQKVSSVQAADLFGQMLEQDGTSAWRAGLMVRAVKWFGPRWKQEKP